MNIRHLQLPLALVLALGATGAHALGLGPIQVKSGLNQPLVAEIPILSASPGEIEALRVRLASPEAFARVGLERPVGLTANLQMEVGRNAAGQPVILITTPGRFTDPALTFLLEANWPSGSLVREFNALVDPPYIAPAVIRPMEAPAVAATVAPVAPPPVDSAETMPLPEPVAEPAPEPVAAEPEPLPAPEPLPEAPLPTPEPVAAAPTPPPAPLPPAPAPTPIPEPAPAPAPVAPPPAPTGDVAVQDGQTLWEIADGARESGVSINQMMLALQRTNPEAFIDDNINLLKSGAVLRMPGRDEVMSLSAGEAALLVREQATAWESRRQPVPQPAEAVAAATAPAPASAARPPAAPAARGAAADARLEIVPPSGDATVARGPQSGASESGGGSELRAELSQAREDLAAREAEVAELRSQLTELEAEQADSQRLIEMQNSRLEALQQQLAEREGQVAAEPAAPAPSPAPAATPTAAEAAPAVAAPWYMNPLVMAGGGIILLGGLVLGLRGRGRREPVPAVVSRRISDDDALKATLDRGAAAAAPAAAAPAPVAAVEVVEEATDPAEIKLVEAVLKRPDDLEAHISLLRHYYARTDKAAFEVAAQAMRTHVRSTLDPRWREAVVMGVAMSPGNPLFSQAGWNAPKFGDSGVIAASGKPAGKATPPAATVPPAPTPAPEPPAKPALAPTRPVATTPAPAPAPAPAPTRPVATTPTPTPAPPPPPMPAVTSLEDELRALEADLSPASMPLPDTRALDSNDADAFADEDDGSATKIELAKAYLDIGDVDGAKGMLEEVLAEAGPGGRAQAQKLLNEIG